jgi:two-component system copper resistance phosphate regulon response regulator CusR
VDICHDGGEALELAQMKPYDLFIFDVMLPFQSGFDLLKTLRSMEIYTLTIFITAKDRVEDRVAGLDLGADAYLVKPFSFSELTAVIRSLFRRRLGADQGIHSADQLEAGDIKIDIAKHQVRREGQLLDLTPLEFKLLTLLARREGEVLSRTFILEHIWDINFDCSTNVVDVHIRRLRSKVDEPFQSPLIHTVRGMGYVFRNEISNSENSQ